MDKKIVSLSRLNGPLRDGLSFVPHAGTSDSRLVALVRLLARQAADEYYDRQAAAEEDQPPH